jgi:hypothetical protein
MLIVSDEPVRMPRNRVFIFSHKFQERERQAMFNVQAQPKIKRTAYSQFTATDYVTKQNSKASNDMLEFKVNSYSSFWFGFYYRPRYTKSKKKLHWILL